MKKFAYRVYSHTDKNYVIGYYDSLSAAIQALAKTLNSIVGCANEELGEGTPAGTQNFHYNIDKIELKELS